MREFKSVSASQIATYRDCARKWWYQSILGLQTPQNASAALGEAVHAQLEKYLNDGTPPDAEKPAGRIASAGLKFLPPPGTVFTEVSMHGTNRDKKEAGEGEVPLPGAMPRLVVAGMPVNGYIDVLDISADSPVVLDHKCLPASSVVHTDTGPVRVGDLSANWTCAAWTGEAVVAAPALAPVDGGEQEVFRVELKNGMVGRYGYSHPILTRRGWVDTDGLLVGDEVAVALSLPDTYEVPVPDALIKAVAMLLCDGALKSDNLTYTKTGAARAEYLRLLAELGVPCTERGLGREGRAPYVQVSASSESPLRQMLTALGLDFVGSPLRRVPRRLMRMSKRQIGIFLGGVWAGDGAAYLVNEGRKKKPVITFANRSKEFCEDVRDLLLRAGLAATFTETSISYKGERRPYYAATVVGKASKVAFLERAVRGEIAIGDRCSGRNTRAGNTPPTLQEVLAVAEAAPDYATGAFPIRVEGPIWWVPVTAITSEGKEPCFDIEVPKHHTFVAEGVITHNTTSDLKWAKTEADLREDVQMVLYGSYALDVVASMGVDTDTVKAGHIVYLTKGAPLAKRTEVTFTRAMLASERKKLEQTVEEMKVSAKARTPDAVPGEASSCNKFGGCHFKDKCAALGALATIEVPSFVRNANSTTPIPSKETEPMSTVDPLAALAALRAKKAAAAAAAPAVESAAEVLAPPPEAPVSSLAQPSPVAQGAISGASANVLAKYGIKAPAAPAAAPVESIVPNDVPSQVKPSFAQPVAQPVAPAPVAAPDEGAKTVRRPKGYAEKLAALNWTEAQIGRMSPDAMRAAIDGSLDGRTHSVTPTGAIHIPNEGKLDTSTIPWKDEDGFENEADAKKFYATFPEEAPKAQPAPVAAPVAKVTVTEFAPVAAPVQAAAPTLALYIDCMPEKGREREYTLLEDYIQPMLPLVTEAYNRGCKKDDEKVPFYSLIPYARGPGFVAALVMQQPPTGVIVANTRFPATNAILEVLIPMADVVVRGLR
jgi:CRISPR/Cas system-associated exonuclease Cas4 (RecB family)